MNKIIKRSITFITTIIALLIFILILPFVFLLFLFAYDENPEDSYKKFF